MGANPKVFISYSHENAQYAQRIFEFSNKLRDEGIDASVDIYEEAPIEGWPRWIENQIRWADFVLIVSSKSYYDKFYASGEDEGKGINWEVSIIYQNIYDNSSKTSKYIPIFFDEKDKDYILTPLKQFTYYNVSKEEEYKKLYYRLCGISQNKKSPLGKLLPLAEKKRKTIFYSSPINIEKWDIAGWQGVAYILKEGMIPTLGMVFNDNDVGRSIFKEWRTCWGESFIDNHMSITFIVPPYPEDCYVYHKNEYNFGKGYFLYIGPNVNETTKEVINSSIQQDEDLMLLGSRFKWVDENDGDSYRKSFFSMAKQYGQFQLVPVALKDKEDLIKDSDNPLTIGWDVSVLLKNITLKKGIEINDHDPCKVVFDEGV